MAVQLRSGREMSSSRVEKKEKTDQKEEKEMGKDDRMSNSEQTVKIEKQVQLKQPGVTGEQKQKEKIQAYTSAVPFPQRLQKAKREEQFSKFLEIFKKIEINIPFAEANAKLCQISEGYIEQKEEDC